MFDVIISVDPGMSLTKVFYMRWPNGKVQALSMGSEMLDIQPSYLLDFGLGSGRPENNAVVKLKNDRWIAFGEKAKSMQGKPPTGLNKYESAAYRVLAVLGAIAQHLNLPDSFSVGLGVVLPFIEYQDNTRFRELLMENVDDFGFGVEGKRRSVSVGLLDIKPEGAGVGLDYRQKERVSFDNSNILVLMVGARDSSLLPFIKGSPATGISEKVGFNRFVEAVKLHAALNLKTEEEALLPELLFRGRTEPRYIERIARMAVSEAELDFKVQQIQTAIEVCRVKYWDELSTWLRNSLGQSLYQINKVIISGGAAIYFKPELEAFFATYGIIVSWSEDLDSQISSMLMNTIDSITAFRFADAFGIFKLLGGKVKQIDMISAGVVGN